MQFDVVISVMLVQLEEIFYLFSGLYAQIIVYALTALDD